MWMKIASRRLACALLTCAALAGGAGCGGENEVLARATPGERSVLVATRAVAPATHAQMLPPKIGVLEASERRSLSFEVAGRLESVAEEGTAIARDQVVARLDAALERSRLEQAELMMRDASRELERIEGLRASGAVSNKELESAETGRTMRRTELDIAREQLSKRVLRSGISGFVTDVRSDPGESVQPQVPVLSVVSLETLELVVGVPGAQVGDVRVGERVDVRIPSLPERTFAGKVARVAAAPKPGEHLFEVEIAVENPPSETHPNGLIRPGMSAWAEIVVRELPDSLRVPIQAMVQLSGRRVVFFVEGARAVAVPVDDALLSGENLILAKPLPYTSLVLRGQHDLIDGMLVRIDNSVLGEEGAE